MSISDDEIRFRERVAEFVGSVNANIKSIHDSIKKIENGETECKKGLAQDIQDLRNQINSINTTIAVSKAKIALIGGGAGVLVSALIWLGKILIEKYI